MEEDGRRWKKMEEEDGKNLKTSKKLFKQDIGDALGTLVGVRMAQKN